VRSLFISDLHAALRLPHAQLSETATTSDRLEDVCHVLDRVLAYTAEHDVAQVFVLGDLFHQRHPDAPTLHAVAQRLRALSRVAERVLLLPGNHDAHDKAGRIYSLSFFDALQVPGIEVLLEPEPRTFGDVTFWPMPWLPREATEARISAALARRSADRANVLLLHHTIKGCLDGPRRVQQGLTLSALGGFDLVLSGHIHRPQRLGHSVLLGSPLELRASENDGEQRGFWVMDHAAPHDLHLVPLDDTPKFLRWSLDTPGALDDGDRVEASLVDLTAALSAVLARRPVYLDVHLLGTGAQVAAAKARVNAHLDELGARERGLRQLRVQRQIDDLGAGQRLRGRVRSGQIATPRGLLEGWATMTLADLGADDLDAVLRLGESLLEDRQLEELEALLAEVPHGRG